MIELPVPEPPSPREVVIEILAEGLWELVVRGCRPGRHWQSQEARLAIHEVREPFARGNRRVEKGT